MEEIYDPIISLIKKSDESKEQKTKLLSVNKATEDVKQSKNKYNEEYIKLKNDYDKKYYTIMNQISDIINSKDTNILTKEECEKYGITESKKEDTTIIKDFWFTVIKNCGYFTISQEEGTLLKSLSNITLKAENDHLDFSVTFHFGNNQYFTNDTITKTYIYDESKEEVKEIKVSEIKFNKDVALSTFCTKSQFNDTRNFCEIFDEKEKDMKLNENEAKFIKNDLMVNALEYYLNIGICDSNLFNALKINQKKLNK